MLFMSPVMYTLVAQTTLTLTPSQDAAIGYHDGANTAGNNYGSAVQAAAYCIPAAAAPPPGVNMNRALFDFNLSSIPANATLVSAKLNLYATGPIGSLQGHTGANASYLERITQSWGEFSVTWNNQPATTSQNNIILPQSTSSTQDYLNIDVLPLVQDMINNPSTSFGFRMRLINEAVTNVLIFYSKDNGNPAKVPTLVVTYSTSNVGIKETAADKSLISVFPNPSAGMVTIKYDGNPAPNTELYIEGCDGRTIRNYSVNAFTHAVDVNDLPSGMYFARIKLADATLSASKFIISK